MCDVIERHVTFKRHAIHVERDQKMFGWWYIIVTAPNGCHAYNGWWRDSAGRTADEAIAEAKRGAMLETTSKEKSNA